VKKTILLLFTLIAHIAPANAQKTPATSNNKAGWYKIGDVTANFKLDNESIMVIGGVKFKAIKLKVLDASINIEAVDIYYESGNIETTLLKSTITKGAETRIIEIKSNSPLKKVIFNYKAMPNSQEEDVQIELYGLK
jgi:hypothetical protein